MHMAAWTCRKAPALGWNTIGISSWRTVPTARCTNKGPGHLEQSGAQVAWRHEAWPNWRGYCVPQLAPPVWRGCCARLIGYTQPPPNWRGNEPYAVAGRSTRAQHLGRQYGLWL